MDAGTFADARLELALPLPALVALLVAGVLAALAAGGYLGRPRRPLLAVLRGVLAALLVLALADPVLVLPAPDAAAGPVAVLLDDSLSMGIADGAGGETRAVAAWSRFAPGEGPLMVELESRFPVQHLRFAAHPRPAGSEPPRADGAVSDPLGALLETGAGGGLSGVVLVSDGGQVSGRDAADAIARLRAAGVAVHAVGVGSGRPAPDVSLSVVQAPAVALVGDTLDLRVSVAGAGHGGETVGVTARDGGTLAGEAAVVLPAAGAAAAATVQVRLDEPGLRRIQVHAAPPGRDIVAGNDAAEVVVWVREQPVEVLHFEGEPRFEVKFVRRALTGDPALSLASLVRTGDNRFLRLGARDPRELADGFPDTAETLFRYHVLVLGSVEAAALTEAQLALVEAFVSRRGGSLLLLGGRNALSEGGHGATVLAHLSPVRLEPPGAFRAAVTATLTREGRAHPVTRDLEGRLATLPALAVVNPLRGPKPGARVLLQGDPGPGAGADPLTLLAWHRYGAGRVAVLPARDTWRWRMHADVPVDDRTHELLWRRLLRWLAREVPDPVGVTVHPAVAAPGQTVTVVARVRGPDFQPLPDARPEAALMTPLGDIHRRPMAARPGADAAHAATFTMAWPGLHPVEITAGEGEAAVAGRGAVLVTAAGEEFARAGLDAAFLERIARETGGSYRRLEDAAGIAERVAATLPPGEAWRRVELWNLPVLLLAVLALACAEWWLRRRRRLP